MQTTKDLVKVRDLAKSGAAKTLRVGRRLSLADLASDVRVHKSTISKWERGLRRPRGEAAVRYLKVLEELAGD